VLARRRELAELAHAIAAATATAVAAHDALAAIETELDATQESYHAESLAFASQQRRCHDLELERLQLQQAAEAAERRRAQIAQELADLAGEEAQEREQARAIAAELADAQSRLHDEIGRRDAAHDARNEADDALARGRERVRLAERAAQEAAFAERSGRDRLAEMDRRREALAAQVAQQQGLLAQLGSNARRSTGRRSSRRYSGNSRRRVSQSGRSPRRATRWKHWAASFAPPKKHASRPSIGSCPRGEDRRDASQGTGGRAPGAAIRRSARRGAGEPRGPPGSAEAFGNKSALAGEIERLQQAIADLGAVNLAALDELTITQERKLYLDAQAADLTEALTTLEARSAR